MYWPIFCSVATSSMGTRGPIFNIYHIKNILLLDLIIISIMNSNWEQIFVGIFRSPFLWKWDLLWSFRDQEIFQHSPRGWCQNRIWAKPTQIRYIFVKRKSIWFDRNFEFFKTNGIFHLWYRFSCEKKYSVRYNSLVEILYTRVFRNAGLILWMHSQ